jgi:hypothetical protein
MTEAVKTVSRTHKLEGGEEDVFSTPIGMRETQYVHEDQSTED